MSIQHVFADKSAAQVLYVCVFDICGGWYKCLFIKCYYLLTPHICHEFSGARMQQNWKVFPPIPSDQTERMGFFTLHTNGAVRVNIEKVAAETRSCLTTSQFMFGSTTVTGFSGFSNNVTIISRRAFFQISLKSNRM